VNICPYGLKAWKCEFFLHVQNGEGTKCKKDKLARYEVFNLQDFETKCPRGFSLNPRIGDKHAFDEKRPESTQSND